MKLFDVILNTKNDIETIKRTLENKVNVEEGKGLSSNDFTNELKAKLDGLENYVHPDDDSTKHVSIEQIENWNSKETIEGSQAKANKALEDAIEFTLSEVGKIKNFTIVAINGTIGDVVEPKENTIYIVKDQSGENNLYTEYIFIKDPSVEEESEEVRLIPEKFGEAKIDLSDYATISILDSKIDEVKALLLEVNDTDDVSENTLWSSKKTFDEISNLRQYVDNKNSQTTIELLVEQLVDNEDGSYSSTVEHNLNSNHIYVDCRNEAGEQYLFTYNIVNNNSITFTTFDNSEKLILSIVKIA